MAKLKKLESAEFASYFNFRTFFNFALYRFPHVALNQKRMGKLDKKSSLTQENVLGLPY